MASRFATSPSLQGSNNLPSSPRAPRQPIPLEDIPKGTPPSIRSRRRRRQRRHASSIGSNSTQTTASCTSDLPTVNRLHSFPPFRENSSIFRLHANRLFAHVARLVRGGTALLWQPLSLPPSPDAPFPPPILSPSLSPPNDLTLHIVDNDDIGDYAKAIRLPTPRLGAQANPISYDYDSDITQPAPMLVFPPIDCGKPCCGGPSPQELASLHGPSSPMPYINMSEFSSSLVHWHRL